MLNILWLINNIPWHDNKIPWHDIPQPLIIYKLYIKAKRLDSQILQSNSISFIPNILVTFQRLKETHEISGS